RGYFRRTGKKVAGACLAGLVSVEHAGFFEVQVQLAAGPGIGRCIGDLRRIQALRGPVRSAVALGDPESQENRREVAQARLGQAMPGRHSARVGYAPRIERKHLPELAQVVGNGDAALDDSRRGEEFRQLGRKIKSLQPEKIDSAGGRDLRKAGKIALAL